MDQSFASFPAAFLYASGQNIPNASQHRPLQAPIPYVAQHLHMPSRIDNSSNLSRLSLKAQAQLQAQQIDSAIHLLKMQYETIMRSLQKDCQSQSVEFRSRQSTRMELKDQTTFGSQFDLPISEKSDIDFVRSSISIENSVGSKILHHSRSSAAAISITNLLANSDSNQPALEWEPKKRSRLE